MGTNYYWRDRPCDHCGRFTDVHVGKSRRTWRAYRTVLLDADHPEWGPVVESPLGRDVVSLADWREVFAQREGELWDEYGTQIPDPVEWLDGARPWEPYSRRYLDADIRSGDGWLDADGFRFYAEEFS